MYLYIDNILVYVNMVKRYKLIGIVYIVYVCAYKRKVLQNLVHFITMKQIKMLKSNLKS